MSMKPKSGEGLTGVYRVRLYDRDTRIATAWGAFVRGCNTLPIDFGIVPFSCLATHFEIGNFLRGGFQGGPILMGKGDTAVFQTGDCTAELPPLE